MTTLINSATVLTDENKTKVCLITDINKAHIILLKKAIEPEEFDLLYDLPLAELEQISERAQGALRFSNSMHMLAQIFSQRPTASEEDGN